MAQAIRPVMLMILDGFGWREDSADNAVRQARKPNFDRLWQNCPHAFLHTSGSDVGLPDGQMGNSEVGHLNIGAGRVVMQELPRITKAAKDGSLARAAALTELIDKLKQSGGTCHLMGLMSPGGVHSHQEHAVALAKILHEAGVNTVVHAFTDGRDTPPRSGLDDLRWLRKNLPDGVPMAVVSGRYYAMDRDKRWDRVGKAYAAVAEADAPHFTDAAKVMEDAYAHDVTDEFVVPAVIGDYKGMKDGDGILCFNFRADRVRELLAALLEPKFDGFPRKRVIKFAAAAGMSRYSDELAPYLGVLFPQDKLDHILGQVVAEAGRAQLRSAETEKYPHVTYFLNGGQEIAFPGEDRIMVPSPKVATYDLQPEMSAPELTDKVVAAIELKEVRPDRAELRQPRHGRSHRQPAGGDQGGGDGGCRPRPHRRRGREAGWRPAGHRRSRQLRADARSRDGRAAHGAHYQPGAGAADGRRREGVAGRHPGRRGADTAGTHGPEAAARNDRNLADPCRCGARGGIASSH